MLKAKVIFLQMQGVKQFLNLKMINLEKIK